MRGALLSLILVLVTSGFIVAEPTSDIRTDFYVNALSTDSPEQHPLSDATSWKSLITYWIAALIALAIIVVILQKVFKGKKKTQTKNLKKLKRLVVKSEVYK